VLYALVEVIGPVATVRRLERSRLHSGGIVTREKHVREENRQYSIRLLTAKQQTDLQKKNFFSSSIQIITFYDQIKKHLRKSRTYNIIIHYSLNHRQLYN